MSEEKKVSFDQEIPESAAKTAHRLFAQLKNQRLRLIFVGICIVCYVSLNVYTPYYSAGVIDHLMTEIRSCIETGTKFQLHWDTLGKEMFSFAVMYLFMAIFYHFQGYLMASVAEKLILTLREQISHKMNKLPLRFFDGNKPGEILSRVTNDLDKVSESIH